MVEQPTIAEGARARARAELTSEILDAARRQLGEVGASGLSLRAVARDVGMVSSAIYRYFPSRDALLTELIIDAYQSIGTAAEAADDRAQRNHGRDTSPIDRLVAIADAMRRWALEHAHEYALIYGSPVPGYQAPTDTIDPATHAARVLLKVLADAHQQGIPRAPRVSGMTRLTISESLAADLARLRAGFGPLPDDETLLLGIESWSQILGLIGMEVFGHLTNVITDHSDHFVRTVTLIGRRIWAVEA